MSTFCAERLPSVVLFKRASLNFFYIYTLFGYCVLELIRYSVLPNNSY